VLKAHVYFNNAKIIFENLNEKNFGKLFLEKDFGNNFGKCIFEIGSMKVAQKSYHTSKKRTKK